MSYWKCIKESLGSTVFSENCIYYMDKNGVLFGNNHSMFTPGSCSDGVTWVESYTNVRFERVKRPYRCIKNTGYDFTEGFIYAVDDDGFVENNGGEIFDPRGYDNAIQWLEANTGCRFEEVTEDMIYKPGDRVKIVGCAIGEDWNPDGLMDEWLGRAMTIDYIEDGAYIMKEDNGKWNWFPHMIASRAPFDKKSLRSGDLMRTRCGRWYMYFDNGDMAGISVINGISYTRIDKYDDNLCSNFCPDYDIIRIYRPKRIDSGVMKAFGNVESILDYCTFVFNRKEPKQITMEEALDALKGVYGEEVVIVGG